jgi:hypothetical protein
MFLGSRLTCVYLSECSRYFSPEYAMEGRFSEKSDVFSFGVLILEIVCGCRNSPSIDLELSTNLVCHVRWHCLLQFIVFLLNNALIRTAHSVICTWLRFQARTLWKKGSVSELIDPLMGTLYPYEEVCRCIQVGLLLLERPRDRPDMPLVLRMLCGDAQFPALKPDAFCVGRASVHKKDAESGNLSPIKRRKNNQESTWFVLDSKVGSLSECQIFFSFDYQSWCFGVTIPLPFLVPCYLKHMSAYSVFSV